MNILLLDRLRRRNLRRQRFMYDLSNPLEQKSDAEIRCLYRLNRNNLNIVISQISHHIQTENRRHH